MPLDQGIPQNHHCVWRYSHAMRPFCPRKHKMCVCVCVCVCACACVCVCPGFWSILVLSVIAGCICCAFSLSITYMDSYTPGMVFLPNFRYDTHAQRTVCIILVAVSCLFLPAFKCPPHTHTHTHSQHDTPYDSGGALRVCVCGGP